MYTDWSENGKYPVFMVDPEAVDAEVIVGLFVSFTV
jgi:hypothetical protein